MKKLTTLLTALLTTMLMYCSTVNAYEIILNAPFNKAGSGQLTMRTLAKALKAKGYKFDITITANPALSKKNFEDAKTPFLLGWQTPASSRSHPIYKEPPTKENMLTITHFMGHFICTQKFVSVDDLLKGKRTLKFGYSANFKGWVEKFKKAGANIQPVPYAGSKKVENALFSGEIDVAMSTRGAGWHKNKKANCLLTTSTESVLGIPTVRSVLPKWEDNSLLLVFYIQAKNFSEKQLAQLRADIEDVKKNDPDFKKLIQRKSWNPETSNNTAKQVELLEAIDKTVK